MSTPTSNQLRLPTLQQYTDEIRNHARQYRYNEIDYDTYRNVMQLFRETMCLRWDEEVVDTCFQVSWDSVYPRGGWRIGNDPHIGYLLRTYYQSPYTQRTSEE